MKNDNLMFYSNITETISEETKGQSLDAANEEFEKEVKRRKKLWG